MDILRFYLNGNLREIEFSAKDSPPLSCSVLHYLRTYEKLTGTKEVCGRGDCGACTVIVACKDAVSGREKRVSVDSCLMRLPQLHGKHLLTIEAPDQYLDTGPVKEAFLRNGPVNAVFVLREWCFPPIFTLRTNFLLKGKTSSVLCPEIYAGVPVTRQLWMRHYPWKNVPKHPVRTNFPCHFRKQVINCFSLNKMSWFMLYRLLYRNSTGPAKPGPLRVSQPGLQVPVWTIKVL